MTFKYLNVLHLPDKDIFKRMKKQVFRETAAQVFTKTYIWTKLLLSFFFSQAINHRLLKRLFYFKQDNC